MAHGTAGAAETRPVRRRPPVLLQPRVHAALVAVSAASWLALTVLSLLPGSHRPHTGWSGNLEHAVAYALSAGFTRLCLFGVLSRMQLLGFALSSGLFEICQIWILGRSPGLDNWAASTAGALAGLMAARWYAHRTLYRRPARLSAPDRAGHRVVASSERSRK